MELKGHTMAYSLKKLKPNLDKLTPTSPKYDPLYEEIYEKYSDLTGETAMRINKHLEDKRFYLGEESAHWDNQQDLSDSHPIINYSAVIVNKFADLLTAGDMPGIQVLSPIDDDKVKGYASAAEQLLYKILNVNHFPKQAHYGAVNGSMLGDTFFHVYWDPEKMVGGKKGSAVVESISPFFVRVGFAKNNWDEIEYWLTEYRMTPRAIKQKWGVDVRVTGMGANPGGVGSSANAPYDSTKIESDKTYIPMDTVIEYHDNEKNCILVGDTIIEGGKNAGFHGLYHIRNRTAPNEPWGYSDQYLIKDPNRLLNRLHGKSQEILDAHAGPVIIDKGNVLQGKRIKKRSNVVITTAPYGPGEGLEYLQWNGNLFPIEQQTQATVSTIHDLGEMPEAAFGAQQSGISSGFALSLQMQPTLMRIKVKQNAEWGPNLIEMFRHLLRLTIENTKGIGIPKEVADFEIRLKWPSPLPRDDAREIQNQVALTTNRLTSRETAMQNLIVEDVVDERKKIQKEQVIDAQIQAEVSKIVGEAQLEVQLEGAQAQMQMQQGQVQGQGETALNSAIQPGQDAGQAFPSLQEENRVTPQSTGADQGESVAPTSTGRG